MTIALAILACAVLALAVALSRTRFTVQAQKQEINRLQQDNDKLQKERDEATERTKAKDNFVQNMSHEVRTPLNAVMGFAQLLSMPPELLTDEERAEYNEHIQHSGNLLMMLIDDILNTSDLTGKGYQIKEQTCLLSDICRAAIATVKYRVRDGIELTYATNIPDDYTVLADPRRVQQILINYLTNAIKHTDKGSITLTTSLEEKEGMLTFAVEDTGEGVPADKADYVFRRYTKLNDFVNGKGIGLNICLTLADKMQGEVLLDTTYSPGARFVFHLPVKK